MKLRSGKNYNISTPARKTITQETINKCRLRLVTASHCDWCEIEMAPDHFIATDSMACMNIFGCDKVVCGLRGCSSNLTYFTCCEECGEVAMQDNSEDEDSDSD